ATHRAPRKKRWRSARSAGEWALRTPFEYASERQLFLPILDDGLDLLGKGGLRLVHLLEAGAIEEFAERRDGILDPLRPKPEQLVDLRGSRRLCHVNLLLSVRVLYGRAN